MTFEIDICDRQHSVAIDCEALRVALEKALELEHVSSAVLSVSIVDDPTIHALNRDHLSHDYPTDVISFQLDFHDHSESSTGSPLDDFEDTDDEDFDEENVHDDEGEFDEDAVGEDVSDEAPRSGSELRASGAFIEGEIVASADMAAAMAADGRWSTQAELTLYVVHGLLHICGYDDLTPKEQQVMRSRERAILSGLGLTAIYAED